MRRTIATLAVGAAILLGPTLVRCESAGAETKAQEALRQGHEAFGRDDLSLATRRYTEAIRLDPKLAEAYAGRGRVSLTRGAYDKAIADLTVAIRFNPKLIEAYGNRGLVYLRKGVHDKAIADCTEAIRLNPKYSPAYATRGEAYMKRGEADKANADFATHFELEQQPLETPGKAR